MTIQAKGRRIFSKQKVNLTDPEAKFEAIKWRFHKLNAREQFCHMNLRCVAASTDTQATES